MSFTGVKVFSATKARDREVLGELVTEWLRDPAQAGVEVVDKAVRLSSDSEFHCLSVTLFFRRATSCHERNDAVQNCHACPDVECGDNMRRSTEQPRRTRWNGGAA